VEWQKKQPIRYHFFVNRWVEILKSENIDESTTIEIEKILSDYKPLQIVSKIGSEPILEKKDIVEEPAILYLSSTLFKNILNSHSKVQNHLFSLCFPPYTAGPLKTLSRMLLTP
jgi:hypothetical protein